MTMKTVAFPSLLFHIEVFELYFLTGSLHLGHFITTSVISLHALDLPVPVTNPVDKQTSLYLMCLALSVVVVIVQ